jgi:hypothetical protein
VESVNPYPINFSDHIRLIADWTREEIQRSDFTENIQLDADGGLKLMLMEDDIVKQREHKGIPMTRETKVIRSAPAPKSNNYYVSKIYNNNNKAKKGMKNQPKADVDRTFVHDETLPVLEYGSYPSYSYRILHHYYTNNSYGRRKNSWRTIQTARIIRNFVVSIFGRRKNEQKTRNVGLTRHHSRSQRRCALHEPFSGTLYVLEDQFI